MNDISNLGRHSSNNSQPASLFQEIAFFTAETLMADTAAVEAAGNQQVCDEITSRSFLDKMMGSANKINISRLLAASTLHSGAWLQAPPVTQPIGPTKTKASRQHAP